MAKTTVDPATAAAAQQSLWQSLEQLSSLALEDPNLNDQQKLQLAMVRLMSMAQQLADKHPVMLRFHQYLTASIEGKRQTGAPPMSQEEWSAVERLIGQDLSEADRDYLKLLTESGFVTDAISGRADEFTKGMNDERTEFIKRSNIAGQVTSKGPMLFMTGLSITLGLTVNPAFLLLGLSNFVGTPQASKALTSKVTEQRSNFGVDGVHNRDVKQEDRFVMSSATRVDDISAASVEELAKVLDQELGLLGVIENTRYRAIRGPDGQTMFVHSQPPPEWHPHPEAGVEELDQLATASQAYRARLSEIREQHQKSPMEADELRKQMFAARAELLSPANVRSAISSAIIHDFRPVESPDGANGQISSGQAVKVADALKKSYFEEHLPHFLFGLSAEPGTKKPTTEPLADGGFKVSYRFKDGIFGSFGGFTVNVAPNGVPDPGSIEIQVPDERVRRVATHLLHTYQDIFHAPDNAIVGAITAPSIYAGDVKAGEGGDVFASTTAYVEGWLSGQGFNVDVSSEGLPFLTSFVQQLKS